MPFLDIFSKSKSKEKPKQAIIIDNRERNSLVASELMRLGFEIEFRQLQVADYLIGSAAIERKTINDFKSSIINKRLFSQLAELKQYPNHFLIIECLDNEDIYQGIMHENAFRGFILSIINDFKVPIIFTKSEKDTAKYLAVLASKKKKQHETIRASKTFFTEQEQLQFILEGFPQIGPATAKKLIGHFKSLKNIINAPEEELRKIIGKKAENLHKLSSKEIN